MENNLNGVKVAILSADGFEQSELFEPKKALEEAGAKVSIVSLKSGEIKGWKDKDWGDSIAVDQTVNAANADDFDALHLPGGVINPDLLRVDQNAVQFIKSFIEAKKPVSAICHAPWTLIEADALVGKTVTSWKSLKTDLENSGAIWVDEEVVVDGNIITSRNPQDIPAFNKKIIEVFSQSAKQSKQASS